MPVGTRSRTGRTGLTQRVREQTLRQLVGDLSEEPELSGRSKKLQELFLDQYVSRQGDITEENGRALLTTLRNGGQDGIDTFLTELKRFENEYDAAVNEDFEWLRKEELGDREGSLKNQFLEFYDDFNSRVEPGKGLRVDWGRRLLATLSEGNIDGHLMLLWEKSPREFEAANENDMKWLQEQDGFERLNEQIQISTVPGAAQKLFRSRFLRLVRRHWYAERGIKVEKRAEVESLLHHLYSEDFPSFLREFASLAKWSCTHKHKTSPEECLGLLSVSEAEQKKEFKHLDADEVFEFFQGIRNLINLEADVARTQPVLGTELTAAQQISGKDGDAHPRSESFSQIRDDGGGVKRKSGIASRAANTDSRLNAQTGQSLTESIGRVTRSQTAMALEAKGNKSPLHNDQHDEPPATSQKPMHMHVAGKSMRQNAARQVVKDAIGRSNSINTSNHKPKTGHTKPQHEESPATGSSTPRPQTVSQRVTRSTTAPERVKNARPALNEMEVEATTCKASDDLVRASDSIGQPSDPQGEQSSDIGVNFDDQSGPEKDETEMGVFTASSHTGENQNDGTTDDQEEALITNGNASEENLTMSVNDPATTSRSRDSNDQTKHNDASPAASGIVTRSMARLFGFVGKHDSSEQQVASEEVTKRGQTPLASQIDVTRNGKTVQFEEERAHPIASVRLRRSTDSATDADDDIEMESDSSPRAGPNGRETDSSRASAQFRSDGETYLGASSTPPERPQVSVEELAIGSKIAKSLRTKKTNSQASTRVTRAETRRRSENRDPFNDQLNKTKVMVGRIAKRRHAESSGKTGNMISKGKVGREGTSSGDEEMVDVDIEIENQLEADISASSEPVPPSADGFAPETPRSRAAAPISMPRIVSSYKDENKISNKNSELLQRGKRGRDEVDDTDSGASMGPQNASAAVREYLYQKRMLNHIQQNARMEAASEDADVEEQTRRYLNLTTLIYEKLATTISEGVSKAEPKQPKRFQHFLDRIGEDINSVPVKLPAYFMAASLLFQKGKIPFSQLPTSAQWILEPVQKLLQAKGYEPCTHMDLSCSGIECFEQWYTLCITNPKVSFEDFAIKLGITAQAIKRSPSSMYNTIFRNRLELDMACFSAQKTTDYGLVRYFLKCAKVPPGDQRERGEKMSNEDVMASARSRIQFTEDSNGVRSAQGDRNANSSLRLELSRLQAEVANQQNTRDELENEILELGDQMAALQAQTDALQQSVTSNQEERDNLQGEVSELKSQKTALEGEKKAIEAQIQQIQKEPMQMDAKGLKTLEPVLLEIKRPHLDIDQALDLITCILRDIGEKYSLDGKSKQGHTSQARALVKAHLNAIDNGARAGLYDLYCEQYDDLPIWDDRLKEERERTLSGAIIVFRQFLGSLNKRFGSVNKETLDTNEMNVGLQCAGLKAKAVMSKMEEFFDTDYCHAASKATNGSPRHLEIFEEIVPSMQALWKNFHDKQDEHDELITEHFDLHNEHEKCTNNNKELQLKESQENMDSAQVNKPSQTQLELQVEELRRSNESVSHSHQVEKLSHLFLRDYLELWLPNNLRTGDAIQKIKDSLKTVASIPVLVQVHELTCKADCSNVTKLESLKDFKDKNAINLKPTEFKDCTEVFKNILPNEVLPSGTLTARVFVRLRSIGAVISSHKKKIKELEGNLECLKTRGKTADLNVIKCLHTLFCTSCRNGPDWSALLAGSYNRENFWQCSTEFQDKLPARIDDQIGNEDAAWYNLNSAMAETVTRIEKEVRVGEVEKVSRRAALGMVWIIEKQLSLKLKGEGDSNSTDDLSRVLTWLKSSSEGKGRDVKDRDIPLPVQFDGSDAIRTCDSLLLHVRNVGLRLTVVDDLELYKNQLLNAWGACFKNTAEGHQGWTLQSIFYYVLTHRREIGSTAYTVAHRGSELIEAGSVQLGKQQQIAVAVTTPGTQTGRGDDFAQLQQDYDETLRELKDTRKQLEQATRLPNTSHMLLHALSQYLDGSLAHVEQIIRYLPTDLVGSEEMVDELHHILSNVSETERVNINKCSNTKCEVAYLHGLTSASPITKKNDMASLPAATSREDVAIFLSLLRKWKEVTMSKKILETKLARDGLHVEEVNAPWRHQQLKENETRADAGEDTDATRLISTTSQPCNSYTQESKKPREEDADRMSTSLSIRQPSIEKLIQDQVNTAQSDVSYRKNLREENRTRTLLYILTMNKQAIRKWRESLTDDVEQREIRDLAKAGGLGPGIVFQCVTNATNGEWKKWEEEEEKDRQKIGWYKEIEKVEQKMRRILTIHMGRQIELSNRHSGIVADENILNSNEFEKTGGKFTPTRTSADSFTEDDEGTLCGTPLVKEVAAVVDKAPSSNQIKPLQIYNAANEQNTDERKITNIFMNTIRSLWNPRRQDDSTDLPITSKRLDECVEELGLIQRSLLDAMLCLVRRDDTKAKTTRDLFIERLQGYERERMGDLCQTGFSELVEVLRNGNWESYVELDDPLEDGLPITLKYKLLMKWMIVIQGQSEERDQQLRYCGIQAKELWDLYPLLLGWSPLKVAEYKAEFDRWEFNGKGGIRSPGKQFAYALKFLREETLKDAPVPKIKRVTFLKGLVAPSGGKFSPPRQKNNGVSGILSNGDVPSETSDDIDDDYVRAGSRSARIAEKVRASGQVVPDERAEPSNPQTLKQILSELPKPVPIRGDVVKASENMVLGGQLRTNENRASNASPNANMSPYDWLRPNNSRATPSDFVTTVTPTIILPNNPAEAGMSERTPGGSTGPWDTEDHFSDRSSNTSVSSNNDIIDNLSTEAVASDRSDTSSDEDTYSNMDTRAGRIAHVAEGVRTFRRVVPDKVADISNHHALKHILSRSLSSEKNVVSANRSTHLRGSPSANMSFYGSLGSNDTRATKSDFVTAVTPTIIFTDNPANTGISEGTLGASARRPLGNKNTPWNRSSSISVPSDSTTDTSDDYGDNVSTQAVGRVEKPTANKGKRADDSTIATRRKSLRLQISQNNQAQRPGVVMKGRRARASRLPGNIIGDSDSSSDEVVHRNYDTSANKSTQMAKGVIVNQVFPSGLPNLHDPHTRKRILAQSSKPVPSQEVVKMSKSKVSDLPTGKSSMIETMRLIMYATMTRGGKELKTDCKTIMTSARSGGLYCQEFVDCLRRGGFRMEEVDKSLKKATQKWKICKPLIEKMVSADRQSEETLETVDLIPVIGSRNVVTPRRDRPSRNVVVPAQPSQYSLVRQKDYNSLNEPIKGDIRVLDITQKFGNDTRTRLSRGTARKKSLRASNALPRQMTLEGTEETLKFKNYGTLGGKLFKLTEIRIPRQGYYQLAVLTPENAKHQELEGMVALGRLLRTGDAEEAMTNASYICGVFYRALKGRQSPDEEKNLKFKLPSLIKRFEHFPDQLRFKKIITNPQEYPNGAAPRSDSCCHVLCRDGDKIENVSHSKLRRWGIHSEQALKDHLSVQ